MLAFLIVWLDLLQMKEQIIFSVHYWFSFFQAILESQAPESAQKNINLKILSELKVIVPEKGNKISLLLFVTLTDKSKVAVQKALDEAQLLFDSLMQEYFG